MYEIPWFLSGERKTFEGIASPELGILWKYFSNIRYFYIFYRNVFLLQNFEAMFLWNEKAIQIVAGPCSVESEEQLFATARGLKKIGIQTLRGGIWKPRSRAHHFEGVGEPGLRWLQQVLQELSMQVAIPGLPLFCGSMHPDLFFVRDVDVNYAGVVKGRKEEFVRLRKHTIWLVPVFRDRLPIPVVWCYWMLMLWMACRQSRFVFCMPRSI